MFKFKRNEYKTKTNQTKHWLANERRYTCIIVLIVFRSKWTIGLFWCMCAKSTNITSKIKQSTMTKNKSRPQKMDVRDKRISIPLVFVLIHKMCRLNDWSVFQGIEDEIHTYLYVHFFLYATIEILWQLMRPLTYIFRSCSCMFQNVFFPIRDTRNFTSFLNVFSEYSCSMFNGKRRKQNVYLLITWRRWNYHRILFFLLPLAYSRRFSFVIHRRGFTSIRLSVLGFLFGYCIHILELDTILVSNFSWITW